MSDVESRFTRESGFCPHPFYWHSPDSEATEDEVSEFIGALVRIIQPEYVVETGTYHGHTTAMIAAALYENKHGRVISIEKNGHAFNEAFAYLTTLGYDDIVYLINGNTLDFTPEQDIDFAFFDSWQEGRAEEFLRFYNLGFLKRDTIVGFHDTAPHHQVWKYVHELERDGYIKTINFHSPRGFTLAQVL